MIEKHLLKLRARDEVGPKEEEMIRGLVAGTVDVPADCVFIPAGRELKESTLLLDGWMARAKDLQSGQRQLAELQVAGDFVDLRLRVEAARPRHSLHARCRASRWRCRDS